MKTKICKCCGKEKPVEDFYFLTRPKMIGFSRNSIVVLTNGITYLRTAGLKNQENMGGMK